MVGKEAAERKALDSEDTGKVASDAKQSICDVDVVVKGGKR